MTVRVAPCRWPVAGGRWPVAGGRWPWAISKTDLMSEADAAGGEDAPGGEDVPASEVVRRATAHYGADYPIDVQRWFQRGDCDGRDYLIGNPHTFRGRMGPTARMRTSASPSPSRTSRPWRR